MHGECRIGHAASLDSGHMQGSLSDHHSQTGIVTESLEYIIKTVHLPHHACVSTFLETGLIHSEA